MLNTGFKIVCTRYDVTSHLNSLKHLNNLNNLIKYSSGCVYTLVDDDDSESLAEIDKIATRFA